MDHPPDQRTTKRRRKDKENTKLNFIETGNLKNEMKIKMKITKINKLQNNKH
jgi:hypothetical protein